MTPAETARVLAKAAAFDSRTIGEADVAAWHEAIGYVEYADALMAVTYHFRESSSRLMPCDVLNRVDAIAADRRRVERDEARRRIVLALKAPVTTDRSREIRAAVRLLLPAGRPEKLRGSVWRASHPGADRLGGTRCEPI